MYSGDIFEILCIVWLLLVAIMISTMDGQKTISQMDSFTGHEPDLSILEKRAALEFALSSNSLSRSDRLKSMLSYICAAHFDGDLEKVSEYEIAVSALGRRKDFSPVEDSTVRSRAFELRQKLERLYAIEAPDYPIRIVLPKGSYRPRFYRHEKPVTDTAAFQHLSSGTEATLRTKGSVWIVLVTCLMACAFLVALTAFLTTRRNSIAEKSVADHRWTPELRQFWSPFLDSSRPVVVVYETRLFVSVGPLVVRNLGIENMQDVESSTPIMKVKKLFNAAQVYEARRYSDFSVANAAFSLGQLFGGTDIPMKAERPDELTNDEIRSSNLILIGKPGAYDSLHRSPAGANFVFEKEGSIRNLHPMPGEQAVYEHGRHNADTGGSSTEYSLITMTPGANNQRVLILAGADSEVFRALGAYVTDPAYVRDLLEHLRLPSGKLPDAYEVLVRVDMRGQLPLRIAYLAHRVLPSNQ